MEEIALTFDYQRFTELDGLKLVDYMDPLVNAVLRDESIVVPREFLERLHASLDGYDEYHLVYALELGGHRAPDLFLPLVPSYLAHPIGSVACAALRVLKAVPDKWLTSDLVNAVREVLPSVTFAKRYLPEMLEELQQRLNNKLTQRGPL
jgi:hypothetical protein